MIKKAWLILCVLAVAACDMNASAPECNGDVDYLIQNFTEWMQESVSDKYNVSVIDVSDFYELSESPMVLGTSIYDNIKSSRICSATATVYITGKDGEKFTDKIDVRYQLIATIPDADGAYKTGIRMSGHDVNEMTDDLNNSIRKNF